MDVNIRMEPPIVGAQLYNTPLCQYVELWARIFNRVKAGTVPRTEEYIRWSWHDRRTKVRWHYIKYRQSDAVTGSAPHPIQLRLYPWEEKVHALLHAEGLTGIPGGLYSGKLHVAPLYARTPYPCPLPRRHARPSCVHQE